MPKNKVIVKEVNYYVLRHKFKRISIFKLQIITIDEYDCGMTFKELGRGFYGVF